MKSLKITWFWGLVFFVNVAFSQSQSIQIPDYYLEKAIRNQMDKPTGNLTQKDLESLTRLVAIGRNITNLTGLEYAINLITLYLGNNKIANLEPLANLQKLRTLNLNGNLIENVQPLASLTQLKQLALDHNKITDITSLKTLKNLRGVTFNFNRIKSITAASHWQ